VYNSKPNCKAKIAINLQKKKVINRTYETERETIKVLSQP
jgi:hypothetical protein